MRQALPILICVTAFCGGTARAQYGRAADPCSAPAMPGGSPVVALISMLGQHGRDQACAEERRAQWDEYNAQQKAAKDAAAAQARQAEQAAAARHADEAVPQAALAQTPHERPGADHPRRKLAARRARIAPQTAASVSAQPAAQDDQTGRLAALLLARAENAPDNHCREPALARQVIAAWNGLDIARSAGKAVDIEHLSTVSFDTAGAASCHGVFVTSQGARFAGTATVRTNVAGDPIFVWERDARQDLAGAPARTLTLQQAFTTQAPPVLGSQATLSLAPAPQP